MVKHLIVKFFTNITSVKVWALAATFVLTLTGKLIFTGWEWVAVIGIFVGGRVGEYLANGKGKDANGTT